MPGRKELKGVAAALAGRFISRNNDANGYWALGMLYKAANKDGVNNLSLDIIAGESSLYFKHASRLSLPLHELLLKQLESRGFEEYQVRAAVVELEFNVSPTARQVMYRSTWGEAFTCRVVLTDDLTQRLWTESPQVALQRLKVVSEQDIYTIYIPVIPACF